MAKEIETPSLATQDKPSTAQVSAENHPIASSGDGAPAQAAEMRKDAGSKDADGARQSQGQQRRGFSEPWYVRSGSARLQRRIETVSMPFMKSKMTLQTEHAQSIFERANKLWEEAMITLSVTMRNFKPEDQCLVVDAEADRILEECVKRLETEQKRLVTLAESNGIDIDGDFQIEYTLPRTYEANITSPRETRFHKMIRDFDSFCMLMDALWMMKLVTDRARAVTFYQIKRTILITCGASGPLFTGRRPRRNAAAPLTRVIPGSTPLSIPFCRKILRSQMPRKNPHKASKRHRLSQHRRP